MGGAAKIAISLQMPGADPEKLAVTKGSTVQDLVNLRNLKGYVISVDGDTASMNTILAKDSVVRVGIPTKNA